MHIFMRVAFLSLVVVALQMGRAEARERQCGVTCAETNAQGQCTKQEIVFCEDLEVKPDPPPPPPPPPPPQGPRR